jgi:sec-independent protein translocase protein TatC
MGKNQEKKKKRLPDPLETTMSLGDHLEELRARLILAILGLVVGTVICLFFGKSIIHFIEHPYLKVTRQHAQAKAKLKLKDDKAANGPLHILDAFTANLLKALNDPNAPAIDPKVVKFAQKIYVETLAKLAHDPNYISVVADEYSSGADTQLKALGPADPFVAFMKITLISGLIVSSPWVFYQLWMFVAAGLYEHERRYVRMAVPFSTGLFVTGALFFLFVIAPLCLKFFLNFGELIGVSANWTFDKYISFVTLLMLVFGLAFQTPIAIFVLTRTGLVSIESFKKARGYIIVAIFFIAAVATPPDVISQIALAIPLYALFEFGILLSWLAQRREQAEAGNK